MVLVQNCQRAIIMTALLFSVLCLPQSLRASSLGLGLQVGYPYGLSGHYLSGATHVAFGIMPSIGLPFAQGGPGGGFGIYADYQRHRSDIIRAKGLSLYYGFGGLISGSFYGVRLPLGVNWINSSGLPVGIFLEISPSLYVASSATQGTFDIGFPLALGLRYYFSI